MTLVAPHPAEVAETAARRRQPSDVQARETRAASKERDKERETSYERLD